MESIVPRLPALLFAETLLLFLVAGIAAADLPPAGGAVFLLLVWVDSRTWKAAPLLLALLVFALGWWTGDQARPALPGAVPSWLAESVPVCGVVSRVEGLPDRRLRLLLDEVRPLEGSSSGPDAEGGPLLPGRVVWIWDQAPEPRPVPGQRVEARLRLFPVRGFRNGEPGRGNAYEEYWQRRGVFFRCWSRGEADVRFLPPAAPSDSSSFFQGLSLRASLMRERLREKLVRVFPAGEARFPVPWASSESLENTGPGWGFLPALLFGDRFALKTTDMDRLSAASLAHSMALSGQHLAVVGLAAILLVRLMARVSERTLLRRSRTGWIGLCSLPLAAAYLWLGGAPLSLTRAALMLLVWLALRALSWRATLLDVILVTLAVMTLFSPLSLHELGAQLSFCAVLGIGLASPLLRMGWDMAPAARRAHVLVRFIRFILRWLLVGFGCSLAATLATAPLVMATFGRISFWVPLNLIWLPVLGFFVLPLAFLGLALLAAGFDSLAGFLLHLAAWPCDLLVHGLFRLESEAGMLSAWGLRPHWTAILGYGATLVGLALLPGRLPARLASWRTFGGRTGLTVRIGRGFSFLVRRGRPVSAACRLLLAGLLLLGVGPCLRLAADQDPGISLSVLDVGQGQAILLEWPGENGRRRALVDGGGFSSARFDSGRDVIAPLLTANHDPEIDWLIFSHADRDHLKGLFFFVDHFKVKGVCGPALTEDRQPPLYRDFAARLAERGLPLHSLRWGDTITLAPDIFLDVLAPAGDEAEGNNGLVLRLRAWGRQLALLPGDAEGPYLRRMLRRLQPGALRADLLVLPHHGSRHSLVEELYDAVQPREAVASSGAWNAYRLPSGEVRDALALRRIPLHDTGARGIFRRRWLPEPENTIPWWERDDGGAAPVPPPGLPDSPAARSLPPVNFKTPIHFLQYILPCFSRQTGAFHGLDHFPVESRRDRKAHFVISEELAG